MKQFSALLILLSLILLPACQTGEGLTTRQAVTGLKALALETFLADIAQNVAGERPVVEALLPVGVDPHSYEPAPLDIARVSESDVIILNGAGFEAFFQKLLENSGTHALQIEASKGLQGRQPGEGEPAHPEGDVDPHFWLDPLAVIRYVENIRDSLSQVDPVGTEIYTKNAAAYITRLNELDAWIKAQVAQIPQARRLLVTNHESFGYYADRYGFKIVGAIIPSLTTGASPSAQELARLENAIRATGAPAVFLETGANPLLAEQIARETGIHVAPELYTHSLSAADGPAATYLDMLREDTRIIVEALR